NCSLIFGEFRLISEEGASVPTVYQFLSVEQKSKVIFVPRSCLLRKNHQFFIKFWYLLLLFHYSWRNFRV
ncbi:hypothetical protein, partial [Enterococcus faecalis]|uniref:hypothetical protein n=1 Tax=Enterococcus faecalis TaxID=1351 RepID=UPI003D356A28